MAAQHDTPVTAERGSDKFTELILYIARKNDRDPDFGKTRLYKALFYSEWNYYIATGKTITGREYVKGLHGPMPHRGEEVLKDLQDRQLLAEQQHSRGGFPQLRPVALQEANLNLFTAQEIAVVDQVVEEQYGVTAIGISKRSHLDIRAWELAEYGEVIPFETSWVTQRPLTPSEIAHGLRLAARS